MNLEKLISDLLDELEKAIDKNAIAKIEKLRKEIKKLQAKLKKEFP